MRIPRKKKKLIPKNTLYCYIPISRIIYPKGELSYYKIKPCQFYENGDGINGYCRLIKDDVYDQVKICGIGYD